VGHSLSQVTRIILSPESVFRKRGEMKHCTCERAFRVLDFLLIARGEIVSVPMIAPKKAASVQRGRVLGTTTMMKPAKSSILRYAWMGHSATSTAFVAVRGRTILPAENEFRIAGHRGIDPRSRMKAASSRADHEKLLAISVVGSISMSLRAARIVAANRWPNFRSSDHFMP